MLSTRAIASVCRQAGKIQASIRCFSVGHKTFEGREKAEEDRFIRSEEEKRRQTHAKEPAAAKTSGSETEDFNLSYLKDILDKDFDKLPRETIDKLLKWKRGY